MKHTPGPWHWEADLVIGDPLQRVRYQVTTVGKTITRVYYSSFEGGPTNAEADAKLIAAAPDMAEALRSVVKIWGYAPEELDGNAREALEQARAALAKAGL